MRAKDIQFIREMCADINSVLDLLEAVRKNRMLCSIAEGRMRTEAKPSWENPLRHGVAASIELASEDHILDLAFSILMCAMGEGIPKTMFTYDDYSALYGKLGEKGEDWFDDQ